MLNPDYAVSIAFYSIETGEYFTVDCDDLIDNITYDDLLTFFERENDYELSLRLARRVVRFHNTVNYSRAITEFTIENNRLYDLRTILIESGYNFFHQ